MIKYHVIAATSNLSKCFEEDIIVEAAEDYFVRS